MATMWLREAAQSVYNEKIRNPGKTFALFLKYCVGWTVTENIATTGSWLSTEANGSTGSFGTATRATGTITCDGNPNEPADNDTFTLDDGVHAAITFTFKTTPTLPTHIDRSGSPTAATMSARITAAINGQAALDNLWIDAVDAVGSVNLTNWRYDDLGNTTTTDSFTPLGTWAFSNMTGGVNGWKFTVTGSPFTVADVGKFVLIADSTNPRNNGVYQVDKYFDANNLQLNFQADWFAGESFTAASGLTWHIWDGDYDMPTGLYPTNQDYWRAVSPHSTGWAMQFSWGPDGSGRWQLRVVPDGNWGGNKHLGQGGRIDTTVADVWMPGGAASHFNMTVFVDTDGAWLYFIGTRFISTNNESVQMGFGISVIDPIEPEALSAVERVGLFCTDAGIGNQGQDYWSIATGYGLSNGQFWDERSQSVLTNCYIAEMTQKNSDEGWSGRTAVVQPTAWLAARGLEANARLAGDLTWQVGKTQRYEGLLVMKDRNNMASLGQYEWLGWMKGMQAIRDVAGYTGVVPAPDEARRMLAMSSDGVTKDWMVVCDGMMLPWPDVTAQNQNNR
jgi:hypothetical protein